ncbi:hypothetical protein [Tardiphaga sp.]|uniref:hypothetical protein n=1 Tax=Tardiphaga sp. TaxID=1926292 RepID=UPI00263A0E92|nr:hypothetical protein [Tardiphaga sp.]MDB5620530.1 hypothetical protein [Tardiphaga sp.]
MSPKLAQICADLGISVVHPAQHRPFTPMQTAAGNTLDKILREESENHLRDVLTVLVESGNNRNVLVAPVIKAISRIMAENPTWYGNDASGFLDVMDEADIAAMYEGAKPNKRVVAAHDAIATLLLAKLGERFQVVEQERLI